jgi:hypothetical protein
MALRKSIARWTVAAFTLLAGIVSHAQGAGDVVISQVWGKGNSVPTNLPQASYVELFNRTASPIDMTGWTVQVATPTGSSWSTLILAATIQPYSYYLVQVSSGTLIVAPDASFSPTNFILGATGGPVGNKVALRNTSDTLSVACPSGDATIVDLVGFGSSANCFEGASRAPAISTSASGAAPTRNAAGCVDTDDNGTNFSAIPPSPRNSSTPQNICTTSGACCDTLTGSCSIDAALFCAAAGKSYIGNGVTCTSSPCPPIGRCCTALAGLCYTTTQAGCNTVSTGLTSPWTSGVSCTAAPIVCGFTDFPITTTACCFPDGTCCQLDQRVATCTAMGGTLPAAGGAACNPTAGYVCSSVPPTNDLCSGASPLTLNVPKFGSNSAALANDQCQNLCNHSSFSTHGVWFSFTPAVSAQYDVSTCGSLFDSDLQILQVPNCLAPSLWSYVACSLDGCTSGFPETGACGSSGLSNNAKVRGIRMIAGQTYHMIVSGPGSSSGAGSSSNYKVLVTLSSESVFGACCNTVTRQCELRSPGGCASSNPTAVYQGDATTCTATLCSSDIGHDVGACCNFGGCTLREAVFCTSIAGTYLGGTCLPTPCVTGACCSRAGSCLALIQYSQCLINSGTYLGDNATCSGVVCPQPGACCYPSGLCSFFTESACVNPYPVLGTIGIFSGVGTSCMPNTCAQPGRCCDSFGACTLVLQSQCDAGSTWASSGSCNPNPCTSGVCCRGATCNASVAQASCTGSNTAGAFYATSSGSCNAGGSSTTPCCYADFNKASGITVQDIFDFLNAWFAGSLFAVTGGRAASELGNFSPGSGSLW